MNQQLDVEDEPADETTHDRLSELVESYADVESLAADIEDEIAEQRREAKRTLTEHVDLDDPDTDLLDAFADQPYVILSKAENEAWVAVPRFVPFNVGWLERQTDSYNIFVVNKFVDWISELPDDIRERVGISAEFERAELDDDGRTVEFGDEDERERAWEKYSDDLYRRVGETKVQINKGSEFEVIAGLIDDGNLPFSAQPIDGDVLREPPAAIELREYQERAWETFRETGQIGVYWPPGAGKTFLALYAGERVTGEKLVVVPSNTLKEQWRERIEEFCKDPDEWDIQTYQYLTQHGHLDKYQSDGPVLAIMDENHHLPANTFAKLSTIDTDYRIGLSASPYREDGRTEYIFALTGFPVGLKWRELIDLGVVAEPDVTVMRYRTQHQKREDLADLVAERPGKTLVFCDSLDRGREVADDLGVPFVSGESTDRMDTFRENRVVVGSRVADEGVSLPDLDTVIEYDFLGGSRRQEAQRAGRVMHGEGVGEHIVMMTDSELDKHEKRLFSLEEQGFNIRFERRK